LENREQYINTIDKLEQFLEESKTYNHTMSIKLTTETYRGPPKPFNTSNLLQVASNQLGYSPKQTMQYCQILYQNGYITYMRTENTKYSDNFLKDVASFIESKWDKKFLGDFENIVNKNNNNPHEAIRVTHLDIECLDNKKDIVADDEDENEANNGNTDNNDSNRKNNNLNTLYKLIWRNTIESCMNEAKYKTTKVHITAPFNLEYNHVINIPIHLGWKVVNNAKDEKDIQSSQTALLLFFESLVKGKKCATFNNINANISFHNKHTHYTESSLIKKLEDLKIGRPSTFSTLVETIQSRGYVKKMNIVGDKTKYIEYVLENGVIHKKESEKTIGEEKNKLVIQPLGIAAIEFLIQHFQNIFCYDYTKKMEDQLDIIATPDNCSSNQEWFDICNDCYNEITKSIKPISKQRYVIDKNHEVVFQKFGPVIKVVNENEGEKTNEDDNESKCQYKSIKKDIKLDLTKLCNGEYTLDDLLEPTNINLGLWKGKEVFLKTGQYGNYIEYNSKKQNIKNVNKDLDKIVLSDVEIYLKNMCDTDNKDENPEEGAVKIYQSIHNKNILRVLNKDFSVRSGKFGPYVYYKKEGMHKPQFLNIRGFKEGFSVCDANVLLEWLHMKYKIPKYH
jgi:DNA topoisomerase-1